MTMQIIKQLFGLLSIIASITGFVVDAITLISWFKNPFPPAILPSLVPIAGISLHSETITLLVLLYTLLVFGILAFAKDSGLSALISGATIPFFLVWMSVFHNLDPHWVILGSLFWAQIYLGIGLTMLVPPSYDSGTPSVGIAIKYTTSDKSISLFPPSAGLIIRFTVAGLLLTPIVAAWLHDGYGHGWVESLLLGVLLGSAGWIASWMILVVLFFAIAILADAIETIHRK
jgi:hypothetical protein